MEVNIIVIGDELLIGQVVDTNSGDIARMIAPAGWTVRQVRTVHDDALSIRKAIEDAMAECDIVLATGGLGPTKDDITKATLRDIFGGEMRLNKQVAEHVKEVFRHRGLQMNALTETQAIVPDSCTVIPNEVGTAPVMWFERNGKVLVSMPGVPFEARHVMANEVLPRLLAHFGERSVVKHNTLIITDITESDLAERIAPWEDALPAELHIAYLPQPGYIRLRVDCIGNDGQTVSSKLEEAVKWLTENLAENIFATDDLTPEQVLIQELQQRNLTLATAESCSGGNIAHRITMLPGVSDWFKGGIVSYSNSAKHNLLNVSNTTLEQFGAVSTQVTEQMAQGAAKALETDCALATSGIAGPTGGTDDKPVGTVCMSFTSPTGTFSRTFRFPGNRARVIDRTSTVAFIEMVKHLRKLS